MWRLFFIFGFGITNVCLATEAVGHFRDLSSSYDAYLLDAYGVFWSHEIGMLPGAKEAMEALMAKHNQVGILTNSTQLSAVEQRKLEKHGIFQGIHYDFFLTSGQLLHECLKEENLPFLTPKKTYYVFGEPNPLFPNQLSLFEGTPFRRVWHPEEADFVYVVIPHQNGDVVEDPEQCRGLVERFSFHQLPVVCANPDPFGLIGSPQRLVVLQGSIARLFEEYGFKVHYVGKPFRLAYMKALASFGVAFRPEQVLMVGDTPETDIRGANAVGLASALLIKTGIMGERIRMAGGAPLWERLPQTDAPSYVVDRFDFH